MNNVPIVTVKRISNLDLRGGQAGICGRLNRTRKKKDGSRDVTYYVKTMSRKQLWELVEKECGANESNNLRANPRRSQVAQKTHCRGRTNHSAKN